MSPLSPTRQRSALLLDAIKNPALVIVPVDADALLEKARSMRRRPEGLKLADQSGCSACDCEFVGLAQNLGAPLISTDRQILKSFPRIALSPASFTR